MGIAEDLLTLAGRLATPAATDPEQAWLRRSISTAYYALFHLLVGEAVQCWNGSPASRVGLERAFEHKRMMEVNRAVSNGTWKGWGTPLPPVPGELRSVAQTFIDLQDARHQADYDNARIWASDQCLELFADVRTAFENWQKIRTDPAANEYLLSLLMGKRRE
ncbi:conserved hypothetical protein [Candidatus Sulfopaludibacter sp. SbA6]|nr:conserved hypothetical protein [Candidatus Sulfopaludibacter sp. SbA6]